MGRRILCEHAGEHFFTDDFAGVGPKSVVAGLRGEPPVGFRELGPIFWNQWPCDDGCAIAEKEF